MGGYGPERLGGDFAPSWTGLYRPPKGDSKTLVGPDLLPPLPLGESGGLFVKEGGLGLFPFSLFYFNKNGM